jgi:ribosomal protein S18 acetylase RimI-like enzyme
MIDSRPVLQVVAAQPADIAAWLSLAGEVEQDFPVPLVGDPAFEGAVRNGVARGTAFCMREGGGPPGALLMGGLLFSASRAPVYHIGWLGVSTRCRRQGIARALIEHVLALVARPAEMVVETFVEGATGSVPARSLYPALGFSPAEMGIGPGSNPVQVFRLLLP